MPDAVSVLGTSLTGNSFLEGGSVKLLASAHDFDGAIIDPITLRLLVLRPGDNVALVMATTAEAEMCSGIVVLDKPGLWKYRFETTTGAPAAYEGNFTVTARQVPAP